MKAKLPKIRALDLRPPDPWDWPQFPTRIAVFIETGVLPVAHQKRVSTVRDHIAAAMFTRDVRRMIGKPVPVESLLTDEDFKVMKLED
jgi:hypothetical protein